MHICWSGGGDSVGRQIGKGERLALGLRKQGMRKRRMAVCVQWVIHLARNSKFIDLNPNILINCYNFRLMDTKKYSIDKANGDQLFTISTEQTKPNSNVKTSG